VEAELSIVKLRPPFRPLAFLSWIRENLVRCTRSETIQIQPDHTTTLRSPSLPRKSRCFPSMNGRVGTRMECPRPLIFESVLERKMQFREQTLPRRHRCHLVWYVEARVAPLQDDPPGAAAVARSPRSEIKVELDRLTTNSADATGTVPSARKS